MTVDGCLVKAPCGGQAAGKSPVDRGKQGTKRSLLTDGTGIPLAAWSLRRTGTTRRCGAPLWRSLASLNAGSVSACPNRSRCIWTPATTAPRPAKCSRNWDATACSARRGFPLQAGARWIVERTNSWHNRGFEKLHICTERNARVIDAFIALANAVIIIHRLIRTAWTTHRWETRPTRRP